MATTDTPTIPLWLTDVDPKTLGVDDQVRTDATPDAELVASVKSMGVLQPPSVYFDSERERFIVVIGHRRVGAAIAAGLDSIQVLVRDEAEAKDALRLEKQLVENERRQGLTPADVARGYQELTIFGLRPEDIAAAVSEKPERVKAALVATESKAATAALDRGVDLEQAAIIAEFDDDPAVQKRLTKTAEEFPAEFSVKVVQARAEVKTKQKLARLTEQLEHDKVPLLETISWSANYWHGKDGKARNIADLDVSSNGHKKCPGHAAIIHGTFSSDSMSIAFVCSDWQEHGHELKTVIREYSPEEQKEQEERERQREAERLIEEAFAANSTARRDWLRGFITGRLNQTPGLFDLIADATVGAVEHDRTNAHDNEHIAVYILTGDEPDRKWDSTHLADMLASHRFTALRALTADALATAESVTTRPGVAKYSPRLALAYFNHLTTWGYELTTLDIEIQTAADEALAEEKAENA